MPKASSLDFFRANNASQQQNKVLGRLADTIESQKSVIGEFEEALRQSKLPRAQRVESPELKKQLKQISDNDPLR